VATVKAVDQKSTFADLLGSWCQIHATISASHSTEDVTFASALSVCSCYISCRYISFSQALDLKQQVKEPVIGDH
jgi:hypothetical protein